MVYRLKYLDSHTSRSLSSYSSDWMRIGVSPFDNACWVVQMRMHNFMCMCSFNVSGPFEYGEKAMKADEGSSEGPSLHPSSTSKISNEVMMISNMRYIVYLTKIFSGEIWGSKLGTYLNTSKVAFHFH